MTRPTVTVTADEVEQIAFIHGHDVEANNQTNTLHVVHEGIEYVGVVGA